MADNERTVTGAGISFDDECVATDTGALSEDEHFMREALAQARAAAELGEVPIGAVVVYEGKIIARAHNRRELDEDPSAHAEFAAMLEAARVLGHWRLTGCTVYVTLEPCLMCAGLMVNARIDRCVYGAPDPKGGAVGTLYDVSHDPRLNHEFEVTIGVLEEECAAELKTFFAQLRERRAEEKRARKAAAAREALA
ncbi:tRNA adenosine(34) deaminase TadA [Collinsella provencensis]|uniref:tRNA adenosine(34) deaminase TadA n=1 Tax=Collinsella provencensis TaxID=1937461 RepID=UPI000C836AF3|nr:tRNA adenosine(34) deaminase TadA [Collinsella provencensis]